MNQNFPVLLPASVPPSRGEPEPLLDGAALLNEIAGIETDSQRDPDTYLRDTMVPYGGE